MIEKWTDVITQPRVAWDEIERLRSENERLDASLAKWIEANNAATTLINEQHAEMKQLRAALTDIVEYGAQLKIRPGDKSGVMWLKAKTALDAAGGQE